MKWMTWLIKMTLTAIFCTVISLYATWTVVQTYLDKVLEHYKINAGMQKIEFSDFLAVFMDGLNIMKQPATPNQESVAGSGVKPTPSDTRVQGEGRSPNKTETTYTEPGSIGGGAGVNGAADDELETVPVWKQNAGGSIREQESAGNAEKKTMVSMENLQATKDNISTEDKMKAFSILSKLPPDEIQTLSGLIEDGITQQEMIQMDTIVKNHLAKEDYDQLLNILIKYQ